MRVRRAAQPWAIAAAGCLLALSLSAAPAQAAPPLPHAKERHFVDFRARRSTYIGHTYIVYGRLDASGRVVEFHYAGLIPEEDVWMGLLGPIRATVRKYKDDTRLPATAIYRRWLTAAEYRRVSRAVKYMRATEHQWNAVFFNCNDFGIAIAEVVGLWRPPSLLPPTMWVTWLRTLNDP